MRRPLFAVTLLLVAAAWIKLAAGGRTSSPTEDIGAGQPETGIVLNDTGQPVKGDTGQLETDTVLNDTGQLETGAVLYVTGQVCRKEEQKIWLQSVTVIQKFTTFQESYNSEQIIPFTQKLICEISEDTAELPLGSRVAVKGVFASFSEASNPGEFDTGVYYRSLEAGGRLRETEILAMGKKYWPVREAAYRLQQYLCTRLKQILPAEHAGVMCALLLGDGEELDGEIKNLYKRNGILHILSISSLHITIIGMGVYKLLRKAGLPIVPSAIAGVLLLLFYGAMAGFSISACRAIGMYLLRMAAETVGRSYDMLTALGVLAAGMVLKNPYYLQNSGFLLSFTSVLGIGVIYPVLAGSGTESVRPRFYGEKKWRLWVRKVVRNLKNSFLASLSITLATLPIQLWYYYEVPVYSVALNLIVIPLMKPLLATGFLSLLPGLGFAGSGAGIILQIYESLCIFCDALPFRTWNPGRPEGWQIVLYYAILVTAVMWEERRKSRRKEEESKQKIKEIKRRGIRIEKENIKKEKIGLKAEAKGLRKKSLRREKRGEKGLGKEKSGKKRLREKRLEEEKVERGKSWERKRLGEERVGRGKSGEKSWERKGWKIKAARKGRNEEDMAGRKMDKICCFDGSAADTCCPSK